MLDDISRAAVKVPESQLRSLLGCFLFSGDDVFKKLGVLSGGERNRFALARILVSPSNFLLLDEPTNHLDMRAKDVLLDALDAFNGTVIFVSHDRYFIDRLGTRVLEVEDGAITMYEGTYEDYARKKEQLAAAAANPQPEVKRSVSQVPHPGSSAAPSAAKTPQSIGATIVIEGGFDDADAQSASASSARHRRLNPIKQKQMEDRCVFLEEEIPRIEASITHTEQQLGVFVSAGETQRLADLATELRNQLSTLTAEWEEITLQLEA